MTTRAPVLVRGCGVPLAGGANRYRGVHSVTQCWVIVDPMAGVGVAGMDAARLLFAARSGAAVPAAHFHQGEAVHSYGDHVSVTSRLPAFRRRMRSIGATVLGVAVLAALSIGPSLWPHRQRGRLRWTDGGRGGRHHPRLRAAVRDQRDVHQRRGLPRGGPGPGQTLHRARRRQRVDAPVACRPRSRLRTEPALVAGRAPCRHTV